MECEQTRWVSNKEFMRRLAQRAEDERTPLSGGIDLTEHCNLDCIHCYIHAPGRSQAPRPGRLVTSRILSILDELSEQGCLFFLITGGEPLLHPDFARIYRHAKRNGLMVSIFTNGTLIDEETVALFGTLPPWAVEISLYGATAETYERITGVPGSFERCMRGIRLLHASGVTLRLKTMLMEQNKHEFHAIKQFANELGVRFRFDSGITPTLSGKLDPLNCRLSPEEITRYEFEDEDVADSWVRFRDYSKGNRPREGFLYQCGCGQATFHIDAEGRLLPCMMARDVSYDLTRGSFAEGWYGVIAEVRNTKSPRDLACRECQVLGLCGYCPPYLRLETGSISCVPEYMCRLARVRLRRIEEVEQRGRPDADQ